MNDVDVRLFFVGLRCLAYPGLGVTPIRSGTINKTLFLPGQNKSSGLQDLISNYTKMGHHSSHGIDAILF